MSSNPRLTSTDEIRSVCVHSQWTWGDVCPCIALDALETHQESRRFSGIAGRTTQRVGPLQILIQIQIQTLIQLQILTQIQIQIQILTQIQNQIQIQLKLQILIQLQPLHQA